MFHLRAIIFFIFIFGKVATLAKHRVARSGASYGGYSNRDDGSYAGGDYSAIPGTPGQDYPLYGPYPPATSFQCTQQQWFPGYYADTQFNCQVYHVCEENGKDNVFLCPNGTIFNQQYFVCDWWYNVDCSQATNWYSLNGNLYDQNGNANANANANGGYSGSSNTGYGNKDNAGGYY